MTASLFFALPVDVNAHSASVLIPALHGGLDLEILPVFRVPSSLYRYYPRLYFLTTVCFHYRNIHLSC